MAGFIRNGWPVSPGIRRLEKAGVFSSGWQVNEATYKTVLGLSSEEVEVLSAFTREQGAYLRALVNMAGSGPFASNDIEKLATVTYGTKFNEKNLPKEVLYPLATAGYIKLERGTKTAGRGAKPFMVAPTEKLIADLVEPMLNQLEQQTGDDLRPFLLTRMPR